MANRANWDERVATHVGSAFYDIERWLRERRGPRPREIEALGDVAGLDLVHLQCHFGLDTLAWARAGARVTGLDFSSNAIAAARALAARAELEATFVEGDVLEAAAVLNRTYDIVYVSLGALCWLPSVGQWASQVAALLKPGGRLYLHDTHPLSWAFADDGESIAWTYFEQLDPYVEDRPGTYTDGAGPTVHTRHYQWNHSVGEIVTALVDHGLHIERVEEHPWTVFPAFPYLVPGELDRWEFPPDRTPFPLTVTVIARR